jgi:quercetin dioxygenase-like cupin family protein
MPKPINPIFNSNHPFGSNQAITKILFCKRRSSKRGERIAPGYCIIWQEIRLASDKKGGDLVIERPYTFNQSETKLIERLVNDQNVNINHIILPKGECVPEHYSNSHVHLIIVQGTMDLQLDDQPKTQYRKGHIIGVPFQTKMNICNTQEALLEFFVIKAPHPRAMKK